MLQLWVAYAPCGSQHKDAIQITLEQIDLIKRFVEQYQDTLELVTSSEGTYETFVPLSHEIDFKKFDKNLQYLHGLTKGRGWFLNFSGAPMILYCKSLFIAVNASLCWLNNG